MPEASDLFYILERLIHRNLLDSLEIKNHNNHVSDQHERKHLHVTDRLHMEAKPAAVCHKNLLPCEIHNPHADRHREYIDDNHNDCGRKQIETCNLAVLVAKNLRHGDRILIFLDDQFRQKIDHRHGQQDAQHLEILHVGTHRMIQLIAHLRDVALGDRRSDQL